MRLAFGLVLALAACSPQQQAAAPAAPAQPAVTPAPAPAPSGPITLATDLKAQRDWQHSPGRELNDAFAEDMSKLLIGMKRPEAIDMIKAAGFECIYGEAHENYPDPAAQCTYSFATRTCQMDWEIFSTASKGLVDEVSASYKRDCVGVVDDWPDPVKSAIDDGLAPQTPPAPK